jgi:hypothetical protein
VSDFDRRLSRIVRHAQREGAFAVLTVLFLALAVARCAHAPSALVVTGATLDTAGAAFEATAAGMQAASDRNALTHEQRVGWNDFLARWKAGYKGAAALWRAAKETGDEGLAEQAGAVISTLLGQLATWQAVVQGVQP